MFQLSALSLLVYALVSSVVLGQEAFPHRNVLRKRAVPSLPGVSKNNLKKSNVAIGFIPGWGEPKKPNTLTQINKVLPKPAAMVGSYYYLSSSDPTLSGLDARVNEIASQAGDKPAFNIAVGCNEGYKYITASVAKNIATKMAQINAKGVPVHLRFLWEMNGDWYTWGQQPSEFIRAWKLCTNAVRANKGASKTSMVWSPNSRFGGVNDVHGGWNKYWPGASYVDIVSISFYAYGGYERQNVQPGANDFLNMLLDFQKTIAAKYNKPILVSETAAAYTVNLDTGKPNGTKATELQIKSNWFSQLVSAANQKKLPYYKGFIWFNIIKDERSGADQPVKQIDFRCLLGNSAVQANILKQIGNGS